jgi:hypothetical protein
MSLIHSVPFLRRAASDGALIMIKGGNAHGAELWVLHNKEDKVRGIEGGDNFIDEGLWPTFDISLNRMGKGLDVTGIDSSPLPIKICKLRALRKTQFFPLSK